VASTPICVEKFTLALISANRQKAFENVCFPGMSGQGHSNRRDVFKITANRGGFEPLLRGMAAGLVSVADLDAHLRA